MAREAKVQQHKIDAVDALRQELGDVRDFIFTDYRGLTVEQITLLRDSLREKNAKYKVVKNRFAKIAFDRMGLPAVGDNLVGPTAVAYTSDESGVIAKVLFELAKDMPLDVKGGLIDGKIFDSTEVKAFSKLPTRLELIAKLMGTLNAPIQTFVSTMNAVPETFVRTLQAVADGKEE